MSMTLFGRHLFNDLRATYPDLPPYVVPKYKLTFPLLASIQGDRSGRSDSAEIVRFRNIFFLSKINAE